MSEDSEDLYADYISLKRWSTRQGLDSIPAAPAQYFEKEMRRAGFHTGMEVLELGFGEGLFLDWAARKGARVCGVELMASLCDMVAGRHAAIHCGELPALAEEGVIRGPFDLLVAFDVFEHLDHDQLLAYLRSARSLLRKGGKVVARFPNGVSPFGRVHQHGDITHRTTLGPFSLRQLALMTGLELEGVYNSARVVVGPFRKRVRWRMVYFTRDLAERVIGYLYFSKRLPLDPNLTAVLRKP